MKPVMQEFLHDPEKGIQGDCQRAALASLMELRLEEVPHFHSGISDGDKSTAKFYDRINNFLNDKGYVLLEIGLLENTSIFDYMYGFKGNIYHLIYGESPRFKGSYHAVVGLNGEIAHDPHPDNSGLLNKKEWVYAFLVKL